MINIAMATTRWNNKRTQDTVDLVKNGIGELAIPKLAPDSLTVDDVYRELSLITEPTKRTKRDKILEKYKQEVTQRKNLGPLAMEILRYQEFADTLNKNFNYLDEIPANSEYNGLSLWDFDGTIANTEHNQWLAYNRIIQEHYGIEVTEEFFCKQGRGNTSSVIYERIQDEYDFVIDDWVSLEAKREEIIPIIESENNLEPYGEMVERIKYCNPDNNFILTNNLAKNVLYQLENWGLDKYFKGIVSATDLEISKQVILMNPRKHFGVHKEPYEMIVIEDSLTTIRWAKELGIPTIGVFGGMSKDVTIKKIADYTINV